MTYATRQLTEALQELTARSVQFEASLHDSQVESKPVALHDLHLSREVEEFIEQKREYSERTRSVSVGTY